MTGLLTLGEIMNDLETIERTEENGKKFDEALEQAFNMIKSKIEEKNMD